MDKQKILDLLAKGEITQDEADMAMGMVSAEKTGDIIDDIANFSPGKAFDRIGNFVGDKVGSILDYSKRTFIDAPSPQERINRNNLIEEKKQFETETEHGFLRGLKAGLPIGEPQGDIITRIKGDELPPNPWDKVSEEEKEKFKEWAAKRDDNIFTAAVRGPENNVIGKTLRATGLLKDHPSGYRYSPQSDAQGLVGGLTGIIADSPVFAAGSGIVGAGLGGAAGTLPNILRQGGAFGFHGGLNKLLDDTLSGSSDQIPFTERVDETLNETAKSFGTGVIAGTAGKLLNMGTGKVAGKVFERNLEKAVKRGDVNAKEIAQNLMEKSIKAENIANTAIGMPVEGAVFTGAGALMHGEDFSFENFAKNTVTIGLLKAFHSAKSAKSLLKNESRTRGIPEEKIAEEIPLTAEELKTVFKDKDMTKKVIEIAADKATAKETEQKLQKEIPAENDIIGEIKLYQKGLANDPTIPRTKNKPEPFPEDYANKTESQILNEIAKINPEGVQKFREINKENYRSQPKIYEKIDQVYKDLMYSIETRQDIMSIYNDIGVLDPEIPGYAELKPRYKDEVIRRVQAELYRRFDPDYHAVVSEMNNRSIEVNRAVENEWKEYDMPPEWGKFSAEKGKEIFSRISDEKVKEKKAMSKEMEELADIEKSRIEVVNDDKRSVFEKDFEIKKLEQKEVELMGRELISESGAMEVRKSIAETQDVMELAKRIADGSVDYEGGINGIKRFIKMAEAMFVTSRGRMVEKESNGGAIINKRAKDMRRLDESLSANWTEDMMQKIKLYDSPTVKQAFRYLDLGDARYRAEVGEPNIRAIQLAKEINNITKDAAAILKQEGIPLEEIDTYFQRKFKKEYLEGGKKEEEFLEWAGEELRRMYPRAEIETLTPEARRKANIKLARAELIKMRASDPNTSNLSDFEKISSFQISRKFPNAPEKFYHTERPVEVMQDYFKQVAGRVARARVFGNRDQHLSKLVGDAVVELDSRYGRVKAEPMKRRLFELTDTLAHRNRPSDPELDWLATKAVNFQIISKMGLSQLGQIPQMLEGWVHTSTKSYLKALKTIAGLNKNMSREEAREFANRATDSMKVAHKVILKSLYGDTQFASNFLKFSQFTRTDATSRYIAIMNGLFHAEALVDGINKYDSKTVGLANELNKAGGWIKYKKILNDKGIELSPREIKNVHKARMIVNRLERVNMPLIDLPKGENGKYFLTNKERCAMARELEVNTNYRAQFEDLPEIYAGGDWSGLKRVMTQFTSFGYEKTKHTIKDVIYREATMGNLLPLVKSLTAAGIGGTPVILLRSVIANRDLPKDEKEAILKVLATAGTLGTFEAAMSLIKYKDKQLPGATFETIATLTDDIINASTRKEYKVEGIMSAIAKLLPIWGRAASKSIEDGIKKKKEKAKREQWLEYPDSMIKIEELQEALKEERAIIKRR